MNNLYVHQLETENKQLRLALQQTRKTLEEQTKAIDKAIEYIKSYMPNYDFDHTNLTELLEILGGNK